MAKIQEGRTVDDPRNKKGHRPERMILERIQTVDFEKEPVDIGLMTHRFPVLSTWGWLPLTNQLL